jgi:hypothetical protein
MKCPKCGLLHPDSEQYCRRCMVNMHTGEPMPQVEAVETIPAGQRLRQAAETLSVSALQAAKRLAELKTVFATAAARGRSFNWDSLKSRLTALYFTAETLKAIPCVQCEGEMRVERVQGYGKGGIIALALTGVALLGMGCLAWPLFVTGAASIGLAIFFQRRGKSRWRCTSCWFKIPRQS